MAAFLKVNRPDSVATVALHDHVVFLKRGRNELVLSSKYNVYYQSVHDPAKGQTFAAMLAVRKTS